MDVLDDSDGRMGGRGQSLELHDTSERFLLWMCEEGKLLYLEARPWEYE